MKKEMVLGLKRGTVRLEPHDDAWALCAEETIAELKRILGADAVDIQHVGSTAIRHIAAKPIIDIALGVRAFEDILKHKEELEKAGIIFRGEDVKGQLLFVMGDFARDIHSHYIHIVEWNGEAWKNYINFRDYLNADKSAALRYSRRKEELSGKYPDDRTRYTAEKQELIAELLEQAKHNGGN